MASNNAIAEEFALNKAQIQKLPSQLTAINVSSDCYVPQPQPEGLSGRGERDTCTHGHQAAWHSLSKGITSSSITATQCEPLAPHEMKLESLLPEKLTQHSPSSRGEALKNPQELNLLEIFSLVLL